MRLDRKYFLLNNQDSTNKANGYRFREVIGFGKMVTQNIDKINDEFLEKFSNITNEDEEVGYIYVLKSKSKDERISSIQNLFKIGYSKTEVEERIKNAEKEPTYLMAPVSIQGAWKCFHLKVRKK